MAKTKTPISRDEEAAAVVRDLATMPPPKGVETIKAASDAVYRSDEGEGGPDRRSAPYNYPATNGSLNMGEQDVPGAGAASEGVAAASQTLQAFATEMQRTAKESIEQASHVLDQLKGARSLEDVVSLQTTFMQQSFQRYTEFSKRIGEMMASSQTNFLKQGQAAMQAFKPPFG